MNKYPINSTVIINSKFPGSKEPFCAGMLEYIGKKAKVVEYTYLASEGFGWYTLDVVVNIIGQRMFWGR